MKSKYLFHLHDWIIHIRFCCIERIAFCRAPSSIIFLVWPLEGTVDIVLAAPAAITLGIVGRKKETQQNDLFFQQCEDRFQHFCSWLLCVCLKSLFQTNSCRSWREMGDAVRELLAEDNYSSGRRYGAIFCPIHRQKLKRKCRSAHSDTLTLCTFPNKKNHSPTAEAVRIAAVSGCK